jgi:hypothetical protein
MNSALLIMDVQQGVVDRFGRPGLLGRLTQALTAARNRGSVLAHTMERPRAIVSWIRACYRPPSFQDKTRSRHSGDAIPGTQRCRPGPTGPVSPLARRAPAHPGPRAAIPMK